MNDYTIVRKGQGVEIERYKGYKFRSLAFNYIGRQFDPMVVDLEPMETPPELVGDIYTNGITLTGGGSLLHGMDRLLEKQTKIHTALAEDPVNCVAIGTGKSFQYLDKLVDGFVIPSMQRF